MMGNDQLTLLEELVGDANAFAEQSAGILAKIEHQAFEVTHLIKRFGDFMLGGLLESGDVHVADAGLDHEVQIDAVAGNFVADDAELQRMVGAFAQHGDAHRGALGPFEQVGHVGGTHVVGGLAIDSGDDVAGTNAGAIGGRADEGRDHDDFVVARPDGHAHAVILAALLFTQRRVGFGIKEIRVRIELMQHARDGAVINGLVGVYRVGVVLLDGLIDLGEFA